MGIESRCWRTYTCDERQCAISENVEPERASEIDWKSLFVQGSDNGRSRVSSLCPEHAAEFEEILKRFGFR
jgi:hypothetical protein